MSFDPTRIVTATIKRANKWSKRIMGRIILHLMCRHGRLYSLQ